MVHFGPTAGAFLRVAWPLEVFDMGLSFEVGEQSIDLRGNWGTKAVWESALFEDVFGERVEAYASHIRVEGGGGVGGVGSWPLLVGT